MSKESKIQYIKSVLGWVIIGPLAYLFFGPLIILPYVYKPIVYFLARSWGFMTLTGIKWICNLDYEVRGLEFNPTTPVIYAMKHQSMWDTIVITLLELNKPALVVKRELRWVPIYGQYIKAWGTIPLDRGDPIRALKEMLRSANKYLSQGRSILIFPEGHRMPVGAVPRYHGGVGALYKELNIPVVPVALNSGYFWARRGIYKKPGTIVLEFLPAIQPGLDRKEFMKILEEQIETKTNQLIAEAQSKGP